MHFTIWIVSANITFDIHVFPEALYNSSTCMLCPQVLFERRAGK